MRANVIPAACVAFIIALLCLPATARMGELGTLPAAEGGAGTPSRHRYSAPPSVGRGPLGGAVSSTFTIALPVVLQRFVPGAPWPTPTATRTALPGATATSTGLPTLTPVATATPTSTRTATRTPTPTHTATPPVTGSGFLRVSSGGHFLLDGHPFVMKGFNYYPRNSPWCAMDTWNWDEVDTELALGVSLGANTVRTFVDYSFCTDNPWEEKDVHTYYHPTPACLQALDRFLQLADQHGLKVIVLFSAKPICCRGTAGTTTRIGASGSETPACQQHSMWPSPRGLPRCA